MLLVWAAAFLTYRGHLGLASLAISAYLAGAYPMLLLLEHRSLRGQARR